MGNNISTGATDQLTAACGHDFGTRRVPGAPYSLGPGYILVSDEEEEDGLHLGWEAKDSRKVLDEHLEDETVSCPSCQQEAQENKLPYTAWRVLNLIDRFAQDAASGRCPTGFDLRLILGAWEAAGWSTEDMECQAIKEEADSLDAAPQFADANQVANVLAEGSRPSRLPWCWPNSPPHGPMFWRENGLFCGA